MPDKWGRYFGFHLINYGSIKELIQHRLGKNSVAMVNHSKNVTKMLQRYVVIGII